MKKDYKKLYKEALKEYKNLYNSADVYKLKPAKGLLREYQLKLFELTKKILKILDENNLQYFPIGGTLIGALRHNGFIPWDDDVDFSLMRDDYNKLIQYAKENFISIDPVEVDFSYKKRNVVWAKYIKKYPNQIIFSRTPHHLQFICGENLKTVCAVDFFALDYYSKDFTINEYKKYISHINQKKNEISNWQKILDFYKKEKEQNPCFNKDCDKIYYGLDNIDSYILTHQDFFNYDMIFPLKKIKFEDIEINIQNKPDEFARLQYADYNKMPSNIEITPHIKNRISLLIGNGFVFKLKSALFKIITKICKRNSSLENIEYKNIALTNIRDILFNTPNNGYKAQYNVIMYKLEFLKSITGKE